MIHTNICGFSSKSLVYNPFEIACVPYGRLRLSLSIKNGVILIFYNTKRKKIQKMYLSSNISLVPISIMLDHYFIRGKAVPNVFILLSFLILNIITIIILLFMNMVGQAAIIGLFSLFVITLLVIQFYFQITKKPNSNS